MNPPRHDHLPRIFQANLHRFYERVVGPGLELKVHPVLKTGEMDSLDAFLSAAAAQVDNYTANEAAKAFTLICSALFERQLRTWACGLFPSEAREVQRREFSKLLHDCATQAKLDLQDRAIGADLCEAQLVANVFRHGDGSSAEALQLKAPQLFVEGAVDYLDLLPAPSPLSERRRIVSGR